jgi:phosphinothricin acetyltransferase
MPGGVRIGRTGRLAPAYALQSAAVPEPLVIRRAEPGDAAAIGVIYDEAAAGGLATFATGPHTADERRRWLAARGERAPVWAGERDGEVVAWSALAPFSHREWYAGVAEYTVYVAARHHGRGLGRQMLRALVREAPAFGYWKLVGMILPENAAGLALARGSGFRVVGTHRAHARREGRWRDVSIVELHLDGALMGDSSGGLTESEGPAPATR